MQFARSLRKFLLCCRFRSLILLTIFSGLMICPTCPKRPYFMRLCLENSLLPPEVNRWIRSDCFGNHRGRTFEAENYQLNSSVLAGWIKKILTQGPPFWRDFGSSPCNLPSRSVPLKDFLRTCGFQLAIEVWIYLKFQFLEICCDREPSLNIFRRNLMPE